MCLVQDTKDLFPKGVCFSAFGLRRVAGWQICSLLSSPVLCLCVSLLLTCEAHSILPIFLMVEGGM